MEITQVLHRVDRFLDAIARDDSHRSNQRADLILSSVEAEVSPFEQLLGLCPLDPGYSTVFDPHRVPARGVVVESRRDLVVDLSGEWHRGGNERRPRSHARLGIPRSERSNAVARV